MKNSEKYLLCSSDSSVLSGIPMAEDTLSLPNEDVSKIVKYL